MTPRHRGKLDPDRLAAAAPWWITLGVAGVVLAVLGATVPLLACLTLIGLGADADLTRRLRQAVAADPAGATHGLASMGGFLRLLHAAMYAALFLTAWDSLIDLAGRSGDGVSAPRLWLAADLLASFALAAGYTRIALRTA